MADQQEKRRGRGNFGNHEQHVAAGELGGRATAERHDRAFYQRIGSEGGSKSPGNFKHDPKRASEAGSKRHRS